MKNVGSGANSAADARAMTQKMLMMEQSLRKMNEDKGKEDQETSALKKKLAVFESKMKQLEEEKQLRAQADNADGLRDKLILMEEKLAKMERRKSVSITLMMQQQMTKLEDELKTLRAGGGMQLLFVCLFVYCLFVLEMYWMIIYNLASYSYLI
jgi:septal ring factor EnvC (AmiA/AmiB activator)